MIERAEDGAAATVEMGGETLRRTTLGALRDGSAVNLETPLRMGDPLGGHWVQGHVDTTVEVLERNDRAEHTVMAFSLPPEMAPYVVEKGSVALDGVSLTVTGVTAAGETGSGEGRFGVWLIPHTLEITTLGLLAVGDRVNFEVDMLAKYVERGLAAFAGRTERRLRRPAGALSGDGRRRSADPPAGCACSRSRTGSGSATPRAAGRSRRPSRALARPRPPVRGVRGAPADPAPGTATVAAPLATCRSRRSVRRRPLPAAGGPGPSRRPGPGAAPILEQGRRCWSRSWPGEPAPAAAGAVVVVDLLDALLADEPDHWSGSTARSLDRLPGARWRPGRWCPG